jgi:hypothetical protein
MKQDPIPKKEKVLRPSPTDFINHLKEFKGIITEKKEKPVKSKKEEKDEPVEQLDTVKSEDTELTNPLEEETVEETVNENK